jgi:hypothetical protein
MGLDQLAAVEHPQCLGKASTGSLSIPSPDADHRGFKLPPPSNGLNVVAAGNCG